MIECKKVKTRLSNIYGEKILCRMGSAEEISYDISAANYALVDIVVYIHITYRVAIVWNRKIREKSNRSIHTFVLSQNLNDIIPQSGQIKAIYKKMGTERAAPYEKVLVLGVDTLYEISEELDLFLKINPLDNECPNEIKNGKLDRYDVPEDEARDRVSTKRWERDRQFRGAVLMAYGCKCAICRCEEEKLLEAAHIEAVADGGSDNLENDVCLCANHHKMFDKELIKIDFDKHILTYVEDSVKEMPWYSVFKEKYAGRLLLPNYNNEKVGCEQGSI